MIINFIGNVLQNIIVTDVQDNQGTNCTIDRKKKIPCKSGTKNLKKLVKKNQS